MPAALERKLRAEARKKFGYIDNPTVREDREDRYIYGTMRKTGWKPSTQKKHKGH